MLHTQNILHNNEFWLNKNNQDKTMTGHILHQTEVILKQSYFQCNNQISSKIRVSQWDYQFHVPWLRSTFNF